MDDSLQTSFWVMVLIQTIGSVDMPGMGERKMPSPRQYVAIAVTWIILMLIAGASQGARRATTAVGWVLVLTGMVAGPFGQRAVGFLNTVASNFSNSPTISTGVTGAGVTQPGGGGKEIGAS